MTTGHSLSFLRDGPVKGHSSSLRNLEASVVFAPKLLPQNCCRQQGALCRKQSCVRCPMPEVECSGDFIRALAFLASSVQMSWMPMSLTHGALSDMLSSSARQPHYHLSSVLCMQIPLFCPCSVLVVLIFRSKTMMFRSHVSISPVSWQMYFLSMVRMSVCTARHGRGEHPPPRCCENLSCSSQ